MSEEQPTASDTAEGNKNQNRSYSTKSFLILAIENPIRRFAIACIQSEWFERISLAAIIVNCVAMSLDDPCDVNCQRTICKPLHWIENSISLVFAVEMLFKMTAMGVFGRNSYLAETWNCFDCFIVIFSAVELLFANKELNLSAIRAIRVLRPLRAINRIPSLRLLVTLLIDILPMLVNVLIFCAFVFFVFGIISVQLWAGLFRNRCFFPKNSRYYVTPPPSFMPRYYSLPNSDFICSSMYGEQRCDQIAQYEKQSSMCTNLFGNEADKLQTCYNWVLNYTECRPEGPNPERGTLNFDSIGYAWIVIFQVISLESWTGIMYLVQDAYSFWAWIFFFSLVLMGSFLSVNLCLVVIATQFSETKLREKERCRLEGNKSIDKPDGSSSSLHSNPGMYTQLIDMIVRFGHIVVPCVKSKPEEAHLTPLVMTVRMQPPTPLIKSIATECPGCKRKMRLIKAGRLTSLEERRACALCGRNPLKSMKQHKQQSLEAASPSARRIACCSTAISENRAWLRRVLETNTAVAVVMLAVALNAIVMAFEHHNQPQKLTNFIEISNLVFTFVFMFEILVKLYAYSFLGFIREPFNLLDVTVIAVNIVELISSNGSAANSGFAVLRLFRLVRIVKIIRFLPALQQQLKVMFDVVDHVATFFMLLGFFLFVSSLLGMSLFGCKFCQINSAVQQVSLETAATAPCKLQVLQSLENVTNIIESNRSDLANTNDSTKTCSIVNFDSPFQSMFTILQVFTQDDWGSVMRDGMYYTSDWAGIYFVAVVTIGNYILFNLLVAILVEGFSSHRSDDAKSLAEIEKFKQVTLSRFNSTVPPKQLRHQESMFTDGQFWSMFRRRWKTMWTQDHCERPLYIFNRSSFPSRHFRNLINSTKFDKLMLLVIIGNCSLIVLERPSINEDSNERRIIRTGNIVFFTIFAIESLLKIIARGLIFSQDAYLRYAWNLLDLLLILVAAADICIEYVDRDNGILANMLTVLRLLRPLRPLRIIGRSEGLKIVVKTLMISVKPIGNIILICCFFFAIFGILGVQLFRGCYARCKLPNSIESSNTSRDDSYWERAAESLAKVDTRQRCLEEGFEWEIESYNFNSLPKALMALFVFATLDGWAGITRNGIDCVGADKQPIRNHNVWAFAYFISFLLIVCFFALNMFVGVVVNNFQSVQRKVRAAFALVKLQRSSATLLTTHCRIVLQQEREQRKQAALQAETAQPFWTNFSPWRRALCRLVLHSYFEYFVIGITVLNVAMMAIEYYEMPSLLKLIEVYSSFVFMVLLGTEALLKICAFGITRYLRDKWNRLDISIVLLSLGGVILEQLPPDVIPVNPAIVSFPRVFRIIRILKLLKSASGVRRLITMLHEAIPQVANLSLLVFILFFIYASLGVELYGMFTCDFHECEGLSQHANFRHFGMAMLTLFRIFTCDNWNDIMKDVLDVADDPGRCSKTRNGLSCETVAWISPVYFVSFVLTAQFVLINVVVAVLMGQLEDSSKRVYEEMLQYDETGPSTNKQVADVTDTPQSPGSDFHGSDIEFVVTHYSAESTPVGYAGDDIMSPPFSPVCESSPSFDPLENGSTRQQITSAEFVLHHNAFNESMELQQLRSIKTLDSDSAFVSDITMSPLNSPGGSPVRVITHNQQQSSAESRFLSRSAMDLIDRCRNLQLNITSNNSNNKNGRLGSGLAGYYHFNSQNNVSNLMRYYGSVSDDNISCGVEHPHATFIGGRLPPVPESPSSNASTHKEVNLTELLKIFDDEDGGDNDGSGGGGGGGDENGSGGETRETTL